MVGNWKSVRFEQQFDQINHINTSPPFILCHQQSHCSANATLVFNGALENVN